MHLKCGRHSTPLNNSGLVTDMNQRTGSSLDWQYAPSLRATFMGPTWGPPGADRTQVVPMLAPWILLSGMVCCLMALSHYLNQCWWRYLNYLWNTSMAVWRHHGNAYSFRNITTLNSFYWHGLTLITARISNHMLSKVWDGITYAFLNFNSCTTEVKEWTSNFIPHMMMDVVTYPCWD